MEVGSPVPADGSKNNSPSISSNVSGDEKRDLEDHDHNQSKDTGKDGDKHTFSKSNDKNFENEELGIRNDESYSPLWETVC